MTNNNIFKFHTKTELNAKENLKEFIRLCKNDIAASVSDLNWDSNHWKGVASFYKIDEARNRKLDKENFLDDEFIDFAKAYMRYQSAISNSKWIVSASLVILRVIERTLLQVNKGADITKLNISVLDESIEFIKNRYKEKNAYDYGLLLQRFLEFLCKENLLNIGSINWVNPLKQPESGYRVSKIAEEARLDKLPNKYALESIADIFSLPDETLSDRDLFTTSVLALLMCAPSRVSEILALPYDCEITKMNSNGVERYGLRFFSLKGYGENIKWIPDVMIPVAKKAIQRLKNLSKQAREFSKWVENNPKEFYKHSALPEVKSDEILEPRQIREALGYHLQGKHRKPKDLTALRFYNCRTPYTLNSLWDIIISKLPEDFPWFDKKKGIKYSEALCLLNVGQLNDRDYSVIYELQKPPRSSIISDIGNDNYNNSRYRNIFTRYGCIGPDQEPLRLRSHQARHFLNTIAKRNGMSDLDLAKWSGRALITQNRVYNHISEDEMLRKAETLDITSIGSLAFMSDAVEPNLPVEPGMINLWEHGAVHVTEYGYCVHDYMISPCEKFRDCINCNEQVCIKGESEKLERIQERYSEIDRLLAKARLSMCEEEFGADRWVKHHESTLSRLKELISILSNEETPDGSKIQLGGESFTQLGRVLKKFDNLENKGNDRYISDKKGGAYGKTS